jgi:hypothetical protein
MKVTGMSDSSFLSKALIDLYFMETTLIWQYIRVSGEREADKRSGNSE